MRNLAAAVAEVARLIERSPVAGLPAPRSYPAMARPGQAWVKVGPCWIRYGTRTPLVITGVFYEAADSLYRA